MTYRVRDFVAPDDFQAKIDLYRAVDPEGHTVEEMAELERTIPPEAVRCRRVAVGPADQVIGYASASNMPWNKADRFWVGCVIDEAYRGQGIGSTLLSEMEAFSVAHGAAEVMAECRDSHPEWLEFARQRGYVLDRHLFESTLDLTTFDATRFAGVVQAVEASGIRFWTLDADPAEAHKRALFELSRETAADVPGWDEPHPPFDMWRQWALERSCTPLDAIVIASDGDKIVGVTQLETVQTTGALYTHYTCVKREYRGKQIALALKLLGLDVARRYGAPYVRTNNDSSNAPMLAVNGKLGYVPAPGFYTLKKSLA